MPVGDPSLRKHGAFAVMNVGGRTHKAHVPHASGTVANPLTDDGILGKLQVRAGRARAEPFDETLNGTEFIDRKHALQRLIVSM